MVLIGPDNPSRLVAEATIRVAAELRAAGFVVVEHQASSWDANEVEFFVGQIVLSESAERIDIVTRSAQANTSLQQHADPQDPLTTAEVIAVRAVESLRAALLQAVRSRSFPQQELSRAVQDFTGQPDAEDTNASSPAKSAITTDRPKQVKRTSPTTHREPVRALLSLSPTLSSLGARGAFAGSLEGRALLNLRGPTLGLVFDGAVLPHRVQTSEGQLVIRHLTLLARPGWAFTSVRSFELHLGVCAGLALMFLDATGNSSTASADATHASFLLQGELALARFWQSGWGVMVSGRGGALVVAPSIDGESSQTTYGRPLVSIGIGVAYRFPH